MANATVANQLAALKELYTGEDFMVDLVYKNHPFMSLVPKDESPDGMAGKYIPVPLVYGTPQGRSATFANAQNNQTAPQMASFFVYRTKNYGIASIDNELIEATAGNAGAFVDEAKLIVDTTLRNFANDISMDLFGTGNGVRGRIAATGYSQNSTVASGTVLPLADPSSVVNFEVGQTLVAMATAGGAPTTDTVAVTKVDRTNGIVIGTASTGSLDAKFAVNGYLAVQGDVASAGSTATGTDGATGFQKISGLAGWLPEGGPSSGDSWWGVDRSIDSTRLAGVYWNGANTTVEEALIDASALTAREGGSPDYAFCTFNTWAALEKELGAKVQYVQVRHDTADIGFKGLTVMAPYGPITVIPDRCCQAKKLYLLTLDSWKLRTLGKAPHLLTYGREGLDGARVYNADALEMRWALYGNLTCKAPGWNSIVTTSV